MSSEARESLLSSLLASEEGMFMVVIGEMVGADGGSGLRLTTSGLVLQGTYKYYILSSFN